MNTLSASRFTPLLALLVVSLLLQPSRRSAWAQPAVERATPPEVVKVAAVQCSSDFGDVAANTKKITALVTEAAHNGAKIVVLPECCLTGYLSQDGKTSWHVEGRPMDQQFIGKDPAGVAEPVPGPSTKYFCKLAKELGIYLTIPFVEVEKPDGADQPKYFNTTCLASPKGEIVLHYRKIRPYPRIEKAWATGGDHGIQIYDTEYGRVGIVICFDIHFILEKYQDKEIWTMLFPTAWDDNEYPAEWFYHDLPKRVQRFNHNLIAANWTVDEKQDWRGYGFSSIISNKGKVLATATSLYGSTIVYAELPVVRPKKANAEVEEKPVVKQAEQN